MNENKNKILEEPVVESPLIKNKIKSSPFRISDFGPIINSANKNQINIKSSTNKFEQETIPVEHIQELTRIDDIKASVTKRPQSKSEIMAYCPNWKILLNKSVFGPEGKVYNWTNEFVSQFADSNLLDETISFLMELLPPENEPSSSAELISELKDILEDKTEVFVFGLWNLLIDLEFAWI